MKCTIPEISWHNRDPVLSVDIQLQRHGETFFRLASGGTDSHVLIWYLTTDKSGVASLECAADLTRHQKPVNVVRFSPSGDLLASGDDDACVIVWKQKTVLDAPDFPSENSEENKEQWIIDKVLRGHLQDVYDLSWSSDSKNLISGSVDNTAILWDVTSGKNLGILTDHKGFVQGVSWDPCGQFVATMASDRFFRVFNTTTKKIVSRVSKAKLPKSDPEAKPSHLFHDDTLKTFFRRLTFTPDGELIIIPSGIIEEPGKNRLHSTLVFCRRCLNKPVVYLPSMNQFAVAARCCPVFFTLRPMKDDKPLFDLPYRIVIAIATQRSVLLYDTQHAAPIAFITNIHYTRLTDLTWSHDGKILVISSTDGYCSIITFADGELGVVYDSVKDKPLQEKKTEEEKMEVCDKQKLKKELDIQKDINIESDKKLLNFEGLIAPLKEINKTSSPTCKETAVAMKIEAEPENVKNIQKIENKERDLEEKMDIDEDFQLVYEESMTQSKSVCDKSVNDKKSTLLLNKSEKVTSDENIPRIDLEKGRIEVTESNKPSSHVPLELDKNKSEISPQKFENKGDSSFVSPTSKVTPTGSVTPGQSQKKTPRRVQLITLSSPKSKKKL